MSKKRLIITSLILLLAGIGIWRLNKGFLLFWNHNSIYVTADTPITPAKVKIEFGLSVNSISRNTDADLFKNREKYLVLFDGAQKNEMPNEYGENDFLITYDNKYYLSFRQFKFNRRHQHDYNFHFRKKDNQLVVRVDINGKYPMTFERTMLEIEAAENYRCNVPVNSAGTIYNMIELIDPGKK
jgi:hypothetical protein